MGLFSRKKKEEPPKPRTFMLKEESLGLSGLLKMGKAVLSVINNEEITSDGQERYPFLVYGPDGEIKNYITSSSTDWLFLPQVFLLDQDKHQIGYTQEKALSLNFDLFERKVKRLSVNYKGQELCVMRMGKSFGSYSIYTDSGTYGFNRNGNEWRVIGNNEVLGSCRVLDYDFDSMKKGYHDRVEITCENEENDDICVLFALVIVTFYLPHESEGKK